MVDFVVTTKPNMNRMHMADWGYRSILLDGRIQVILFNPESSDPPFSLQKASESLNMVIHLTYGRPFLFSTPGTE